MQSLFADILSVLAMTYSDTQPRGTLRYRLLSASLRPPASPLADPGTWGHEYVRHLAAELGEEFTIRESEDVVEVTPAGTEDGKDEKKSKSHLKLTGTIDDLHALAKECAVFLLGHNAEPDAVDLLEELEIVHEIAQLVDENTYSRVCQYMIRYATIPLVMYCFANGRFLYIVALTSFPHPTISRSCARRIQFTSSTINSLKLSLWLSV